LTAKPHEEEKTTTPTLSLKQIPSNYPTSQPKPKAYIDPDTEFMLKELSKVNPIAQQRFIDMMQRE
jgi:hypothetical protein